MKVKELIKLLQDNFTGEELVITHMQRGLIPASIARKEIGDIVLYKNNLSSQKFFLYEQGERELWMKESKVNIYKNIEVCFIGKIEKDEVFMEYLKDSEHLRK